MPGTCGLLIAANHYLREHHDFDSLTEKQQRKYRNETFFGMEHVQDAHRLALMNMMLHGIENGISYGDTLSEDGTTLPQATLILTNPPFGTKKGDSPGQRPGSPGFMILSPEGAAHLRPANPRHGPPLQGSGSFSSRYLGRCPRLAWAGPLALGNRNPEAEVVG